MQVPALLYGDAKVVQKRCRAVLRSWLKDGGSYIEAMEAEGMLDVADIKAPMTIDYSPYQYGWGLYLAAPSFVLFSEKGLLARKAHTDWFQHWQHDPRIIEVFDGSLMRPWALMSIVDTGYTHELFGTEQLPNLDRCRRLIASVLRDCEELEAVGSRYYPGALSPMSLARSVNNVYIGLRLLGVNTDRLNDILDPYHIGRPGPKGGLRGVLEALGATVDPAWAVPRSPDHTHVLTPPPEPPPPAPPNGKRSG